MPVVCDTEGICARLMGIVDSGQRIVDSEGRSRKRSRLHRLSTIHYPLSTTTCLLLSPWLLTLLIFWAYPLLYALYLSFTKYYTLTNRTVWVGLDNYAKLLHDPIFWQALWNTAILVIETIPFTMMFALFYEALLA